MTIINDVFDRLLGYGELILTRSFGLFVFALVAIRVRVVERRNPAALPAH